MNILNKASTRIIIAVVFGLLFAVAFTHVQQPCTTALPGEDIARCVEWSKAFMYPGELVNNRQGSLEGFAETFVIVAAIGYVLLSIHNQIRARRSR